ncbi:MAG: hypothetical protein V2A58_18765 [Planctomycetota bacterium]
MERFEGVSTGREKSEGERDEGNGRETWSPEGVDLTLIRWMLSLSPGERLAALEGVARSIVRLRNARRVS